MRALLLSVFLLGCSAAASHHDLPSTSSEIAHVDLPAPFQALGGKCVDAPADMSYRCGHGRIATVTKSFAPIPGGGVRYVRDWEHVKNEPMMMVSANQVMIDGPRVWIESGCNYCRMMMSSTTVADLQIAEDEDLARLQEIAGLPKSPILRTGDQWTQAVSSSARWKTFQPS